jgi:hypothetical protein
VKIQQFQNIFHLKKYNKTINNYNSFCYSNINNNKLNIVYLNNNSNNNNLHLNSIKFINNNNYSHKLSNNYNHKLYNSK